MQRIRSLRRSAIQGLTIAALTVLGAGITLAQANNPDPGASNTVPGARNPQQNRQPPAADQAARRGATTGHEGQPATTKGALGVDFSKGTAGNELEIISVEPNGAAAQAGLQAHDKIVAVDGRPFTNARQVNAYLSAQAGRRVPVVIERNGHEFMVQVAPARMSGDRAWLGVFLEEEEPEPTGPGAPNAPADGQNPQANGQNASPNRPNAPAHRGGALITQVQPSSPADRAGLRPGDLVVQVNGQKVDDSADFVAIVHEMKPKERTEMVVLRNNQEQKIPVTLGNRNEEFDQNERMGFNQPGQFPPQGQFGPGPGPQDQFGPGPGAFAQQNPWNEDSGAIQRLEDQVRQLRDEIRQLREQLQKK